MPEGLLRTGRTLLCVAAALSIAGGFARTPTVRPFRIGEDAVAPRVARPRGIGGLASRDPADFHQAVIARAAALEREPDNPRLLADLAAALLARGELQDRPLDLVAALAFAERSIRLDRNPAAAYVHRSVALERLFLIDAAGRSWNELLTLGQETKTAEQALQQLNRAGSGPSPQERRRRLHRAVNRGNDPDAARLARDDPATLREYLDREILEPWARSPTNDPSAIADPGERLARELLEVTGDRFALEAVLFVREAADRGEPLRRGLARYYEALSFYAKQDIGRAAELLREALPSLAEGSSPFQPAAEYWLAICEFYAKRPDAARDRLESVRLTAEQRGFGLLLGQSHRMLGLVEMRRSRVGDALSHYHRAREIFDGIGEATRVAALDPYLAETYSILGDGAEAWRYCHRGLASLSRVVQPRDRQRILFTGAMGALDAGYPEAAVHFLDAGLEEAQSAAQGDVGEILAWRALAFLRLDRLEEALADTRESWAAAEKLTDPDRARATRAELHVLEGRVLLQRQPAGARVHLGGALDYFSSRGDEGRLPGILLDRARAALALDAASEAQADLSRAIEIYGRHRDSVDSRRHRISYFDRGRELFDEMVRFQLTVRRQPELALETAEAGRARDLLDDLGGSHASGEGREARAAPRLQPMDVEQIQRSVPPSTALIVFSVLEERVVVWVLKADDLAYREIRFSSAELGRLVAAFRSALAPGSKDTRSGEFARELYSRIIAPIAELISGDETLVFIPDRSLHALPFAALVAPENGRYLVEDFRIATAPSATLYAQSTRDSRPGDGALLAVGNPAFDPGEFPQLPDLPGSEAEATAVAALYPRSRLLTGADATPSSFLRLAGKHELIHFSGHALSTDTPGERSRLVLAPEPSGDRRDAVEARDLFDVPLPATRLVILAACSTGTGRISKSEGAMSLVRPFLASGVSAVVASLWGVYDEATRELLLRFHAKLRDGTPVAAALREAQLSMIGDGDERLASPAAWAAFQVVGNPGLRVSAPTAPDPAPRADRTRSGSG